MPFHLSLFPVHQHQPQCGRRGRQDIQLCASMRYSFIPRGQNSPYVRLWSCSTAACQSSSQPCQHQVWVSGHHKAFCSTTGTRHSMREVAPFTMHPVTSGQQQCCVIYRLRKTGAVPLILSAKQSVPVNAKPTIPKVMLCCSMIFPVAVALGQTAVWGGLGPHDGLNGHFSV